MTISSLPDVKLYVLTWGVWIRASRNYTTRLQPTALSMEALGSSLISRWFHALLFDSVAFGGVE